MSLDLSAPIRAALVADAGVTASLPAYAESYPVFTRAPAPDDAPYPMIMLATQFQAGEEDGLTDQRPSIVRDVVVYGLNDTAAHYRTVEALAHAVRTLFHRRRHSIVVSGWSVTDVVASGPRPAPVDDEQTVGRLVEVIVRLARQN